MSKRWNFVVKAKAPEAGTTQMTLKGWVTAETDSEALDRARATALSNFTTTPVEITWCQVTETRSRKCYI